MTKDELNAAIRELCEAMGMTFMPWEIRPWSAGADRHGPRHAYALALMLDLDLGETRFVEQLGKSSKRGNSALRPARRMLTYAPEPLAGILVTT